MVYLYLGWNLIAEYAGTSIEMKYTWGMDLSGSMQGAGGVGGLLAVYDGSATYYPTYDGNGNVSEYLDSTGVIQAHYEYDAFGNITATAGAKSGDFDHRFSTKPLDSESGLYYYGYRYYDPVTGRWPSRDPIEERGGINLYGMVGNDSVNKFDLIGLSEYFNCEKTGGWKIEKARSGVSKVTESVAGETKIRSFKFKCYCREHCCKERPYSSKVDITSAWIFQFMEKAFYYDSFEEDLAINKNLHDVIGKGAKALADSIGAGGLAGFPSKENLNPSAKTLEERQKALDTLKAAREIWNKQRKELEARLVNKCRETCARKGYISLNNIWPRSYEGVFDGEVVEEGKYIGSNVSDGGREILPEDLNPNGTVRPEIIEEKSGRR